MDPSLFNENAPGRLVPVSGIPGLNNAFIPDLLPARWQWVQELWPLLLEARNALATLSATWKYLPNPELLISPLMNREARMSSKLEGTITQPEEQMLFELAPRFPVSEDDPDNAHREVHNYALALRTRRRQIDELPLSLRLIRKLHQILMDGVRGSQKDPGNFRLGQNHIGRPARFVPPPANALLDLLDNFEKCLHTSSPLDPLVKAFVIHYQFEAIHPFSDGNGRIGRLLLAITIAEWCEMSNQWLFMSGFYDRNRDEYFDRLRFVSTHGDWRGWIEFCLKGAVEQAKDTVNRCDRLINLNKDLHKRIADIGGNIRLAKMIDGLFETPVLLPPQVGREYEISYPTAHSDLKKLEKVGILARIKDFHRIAYYCPPIIKVTFED